MSYPNNFHVKDQCCPAWNFWTWALVSITKLRWNNYETFPTFLHSKHSFLPTLAKKTKILNIQPIDKFYKDEGIQRQYITIPFCQKVTPMAYSDSFNGTGNWIGIGIGTDLMPKYRHRTGTSTVEVELAHHIMQAILSWTRARSRSSSVWISHNQAHTNLYYFSFAKFEPEELLCTFIAVKYLFMMV